MSMAKKILVSVFLLLVAAAPGFAAEKTIIVLDASGSMWGQIDGRPKVDLAREALRGVVEALPSDREIGLMAYGHREKGSCEDIELIVPPAAGTASAIVAAAGKLKFLGKTPLTSAVRQAAEALKYTEEKATVVLITDGLETCNADPCALGRELEQSGVDFTANVVGFGLTAEEGRQVACLAENTGGKYVQADDLPTLILGLTEAVAAPAPVAEPEPAPAPPPAAPEFNFAPQTALTEGGEPLQDAGNGYEIFAVAPDGSKGERLTTEYNNYKGNLPAGKYIVRAWLDFASVEQPVTIEEGKASEPFFVLNGGTLVITPRPSQSAEVDSGATVFVEYPGGSSTYYGKAKMVVPAGDTKVTVTIGTGVVSETLTVVAGQTVEKEFVVGVGLATVNTLYAAGGERVEAAGLSQKVFKAAKKIDGSREQVGYVFGPDAKFELTAGDYVAIAEMDQAVAEAPFSVKTGEAVEVTVTLNAGVLAISAPGAKRIDIFSAQKDIQGERKGFGTFFDEAPQTTLPAGDYAVVVDRETAGGTTEAKATVNAGERSELSVP